LVCKFVIGFAYDSYDRQQRSIALIPPVKTNVNRPATLTIFQGGSVIGTANTIYRTPGPSDLLVLNPTRGIVSGLIANLRIDYTLSQDESAPSEWTIKAFDSNGNAINNLVSKQISNKEWYVKFPSSGIYRLNLSGETSIKDCGTEPPLGPNVYVNGVCPTKRIQGDISIQTDDRVSSTTPVKRTISLECGEVFLEKTSSCEILVSSKDVFDQVTEQGRAIQVSVSQIDKDGSRKVENIGVLLGKTSIYPISKGKQGLKITASILNTEISATQDMSPHEYDLSETIDKSWKLSCMVINNMTNCKANLSVQPKVDFEMPNLIPYEATAFAYSNSTNSIQQITVTYASARPNSIVEFSIPNSNLVKSVKIQVDENDDGATWTNPSYVEPLNSKNLKLNLSCPDRISGSSFSCALKAMGSAKNASSFKVNLEYKTNNSTWKYIKAVSIKIGQNLKVSVPNNIEKNLYVRANTSLGNVKLYSNTSSWISDSVKSDPKPNTSNYRLSAGDRKACQYFKEAMAQGLALPWGSSKLSYVLRSGYQAAYNSATNPTLKLDFKIMLDSSNGSGINSVDAQFEINEICGF